MASRNRSTIPTTLNEKLDGHSYLKIKILVNTKMVREVRSNFLCKTDFKLCDPTKQLRRRTQFWRVWESWKFRFEQKHCLSKLFSRPLSSLNRQGVFWTQSSCRWGCRGVNCLQWLLWDYAWQLFCPSHFRVQSYMSERPWLLPCVAPCLNTDGFPLCLLVVWLGYLVT